MSKTVIKTQKRIYDIPFFLSVRNSTAYFNYCYCSLLILLREYLGELIYKFVFKIKQFYLQLKPN